MVHPAFVNLTFQSGGIADFGNKVWLSNRLKRHVILQNVEHRLLVREVEARTAFVPRAQRQNFGANFKTETIRAFSNRSARW